MALAASWRDPDWEVCPLYARGVPLGVDEELPRAPLIFEAKTTWKLPEEEGGAAVAEHAVHARLATADRPRHHASIASAVPKAVSYESMTTDVSETARSVTCTVAVAVRIARIAIAAAGAPYTRGPPRVR